MKRAVLLGALVFCLLAGSAFAQTPADVTFPEEVAEYEAKIDAHWPLRDQQEHCRAAIALLNEALAKKPDWEEGWVWLSWAYYWEGNNQPEDDKSRRDIYQKGIEAGEKAVALNENSVGGHFWYIVNKSAYGRERGIVRSAIYLPEIREVTAKVQSLDADYFFGGVNRLNARIITKSPAFLRKAKGYDMTDAVKELEGGLAIEPDFTLTHLYLADAYLEMGKKDEAKKELERVLAIPEDAVPGAAAEVRRDKKSARARLAENFPD